MIAEISFEIRARYQSFHGERMSYLSSHRYKGNRLSVTIIQFKSELGLMNVITLELSNGSGHSAKQDLCMERVMKFEEKLMSNNFENDLVKCLSTLNEALIEMN